MICSWLTIATRRQVTQMSKPAIAFLTTRWVLAVERRSIVSWAVATATVSGFYAVFWGLFTDLADLTALIDSLPEGFAAALGYDQIGTAVGYLNSTVYQLLAPILMSLFAVTFAARVLPAAEENGDLELETAGPVSRPHVLIERAAAVFAAVAAIAFVVFAVVAIVAVSLDMDVPLTQVAAATVGLWLYAVSVGLITLGVGGLVGRRAYALGAGAAVAVTGFVFNAVSGVVDQAWLTWFSMFAWVANADMLRNGFAWSVYAAVVTVGVVALGLGMLRYVRRDLGV